MESFKLIYDIIFKHENLLIAHQLVVYITPVFIILDYFAYKMAIWNSCKIDSVYFSYHERKGIFSSIYFKLFFWFLLFQYVNASSLMMPSALLLALPFYFFHVIKLALQVYRQINTRNQI